MHAVASSPAAMKAFSTTPLKSMSPTTLAKMASPASQYERLESNIGEGTYGKVHKARDVKTGRIVAIKKAKVSPADRDVGGIGFTALREMKLMQAVRHPNVMGCLAVFAEGGIIHLVMEFMDGDLKKVIDDKGLVLAEAHVKCLAQQVLRGVAALHARWFVHRDLTPSNILLSMESGAAKLGDFGFTRTLGHGERPLTPLCTTLWYRAPELLYGAKFYGQTVDIWSMGCIVAELFLRRPIFAGSGEWDMLTKVFEKRGTPTEEVWRDVSALPNFVEFSHHPQVPFSTLAPNISSESHGLMDGLLSLDPKQRPSADEALQHQFFTSAWPPACPPEELPFVRREGGM